VCLVWPEDPSTVVFGVIRFDNIPNNLSIDLIRGLPDPVPRHAGPGGRAPVLHGAGHRAEDETGQHRGVVIHQPLPGRGR